MNKHCLALTALLAAGLQAANAQLIPDGNFDSLLPGTAPDCGVPAGAWQFPPNYVGLCEPYPEAFSIVDTSSFDALRPGRSLHINIAGSPGAYHLTNILPAPITPAPGRTIRSTWEIFVKSDHLGGNLPLTVYIGSDMGGGGYYFGTDRGPQMGWWGNGNLSVWSGASTVVAQYPRDVWQSVQVDIHLDTQTWDFYWAPSGQPLQLLATNLQYRAAPSVIQRIDRWSIAYADTGTPLVSDCYFDNVALGLLCESDYDRNGQIEPADVAQFLNVWFASLTGGTLAGDYDHNGLIQPADIAAFVNAWFAALGGVGC